MARDAHLFAGCEDRTVEYLFVLGGHCCDTPALAEKSCLLVLSPDLILYQMTIRGSKNSNPWGKRRGRSDEVGGGEALSFFCPFPSLPHPIPAPFSRLLSN